MKKYFVYLLESEKDGNFYIGQTDNLESRIKRHNTGEVFSTKNRRPFKLLGFIEVNSRKEALKLEKDIKSHSDKKLKFIKNFKPEFKWNNLLG